MRALSVVVVLAMGCGDFASKSSAKELTSFSFTPAENLALTASIDGAFAGTAISARAPWVTDLHPLIATFETTGERVDVDGVPQQSAVTANDFTMPRTYRVVAEDGSYQDYTVTVDAKLAQEAYIKYSPSTQGGNGFGMAVALSYDGSTLGVGGFYGGYVFTRTGTTWMQQTKTAGRHAAVSADISGDGNTFAVADDSDASSATGVDGNENDNSMEYAGAVRVYVRSGSTWTQQAYVKATNTDARDFFGFRVALSQDGNTLAVSTPSEASAATTINGDGTDNSAPAAGAVYIYVRNGTQWTPQAYVKASNTTMYLGFGSGIALSGNGDVLAVSSYSSDVYVYARTGTTWTEDAIVHPTMVNSVSGSVALSSDGTTLAAYAPSAPPGGAISIFVKQGTWTEQAALRASNVDAGDEFGAAISLSDSGDTLIAGSWHEASAATGVDGNQADNSAADAGAAYVFTRSGTKWTQRAYLKASNTQAGDSFAFNYGSVAVSGDGLTFAVGAANEQSSSETVNGDQTNNAYNGAGAVYVFR